MKTNHIHLSRFAARSSTLLHSRGIKYILSVTNSQDVPGFSEEDGFVIKYVEIEDDITEDLIVHLKECCNWIEGKLRIVKGEKEGNVDGGVVVHCTQGISRSAGVIVGFLMRTLEINFDQALAHLRVTRPQAKPNEGFEYQLKIWKQVSYDVFDSEGREKEAYKKLQEHRVRILVEKEGVLNRARFKGVAGLAASFGKKRGEVVEGGKDGTDNRCSEGGEGNGKSEAWERVEKMEDDWRKRLIGGEVLPWMERVEKENISEVTEKDEK